MPQSSRRPDSRLAVGLLFVLVGAYLLLNNLNLLPFDLPDYVFSWKTLLIAIGLLIVATRENKGGGVTLIIVGGVFLITDVLDTSIGELIADVWMFWPVIFIIIGLTLLLRRSREKKTEYRSDVQNADSGDNYFEVTAVVGGNERMAYSRNFQGAKITAILGGANINLLNAQLAPGRHVIDVFVLFGGCTLVVPNDWNIRLDVTPVIGSFEDKRSFPQTYVPEGSSELVIKGVVIFGGGEIKSA